MTNPNYHLMAPSELVLATDNKQHASPLERALAEALDEMLKEVNALRVEIAELEDAE